VTRKREPRILRPIKDASQLKVEEVSVFSSRLLPRARKDPAALRPSIAMLRIMKPKWYQSRKEKNLVNEISNNKIEHDMNEIPIRVERESLQDTSVAILRL